MIAGLNNTFLINVRREKRDAIAYSGTRESVAICALGEIRGANAILAILPEKHLKKIFFLSN